jgi:hypothetical protein
MHKRAMAYLHAPPKVVTPLVGAVGQHLATKAVERGFGDEQAGRVLAALVLPNLSA